MPDDMRDRWVMHNFITGKDEPLPDPGEPPTAWGEGWSAAMDGVVDNPYDRDEAEHAQWEDGWWAAMED